MGEFGQSWYKVWRTLVPGMENIGSRYVERWYKVWRTLLQGWENIGNRYGELKSP